MITVSMKSKSKSLWIKGGFKINFIKGTDIKEKIEILKRCGFEEVEIVLERFKKESKLKHDKLVTEIELWKARGKNLVLVYVKDGEVINRYSKEHLEKKNIICLLYTSPSPRDA